MVTDKKRKNRKSATSAGAVDVAARYVEDPLSQLTILLRVVATSRD